MLHIELPHVNVFTKVDLWEDHFKDQADLNLDFYSELPDLHRLIEKLPKRLNKRYRKLNSSKLFKAVGIWSNPPDYILGSCYWILMPGTWSKFHKEL